MNLFQIYSSQIHKVNPLPSITAPSYYAVEDFTGHIVAGCDAAWSAQAKYFMGFCIFLLSISCMYDSNVY